jgi:uncharacterized tellurite resistance protein B-like protein
VHLAACALLLEIASADGEFSAPERAHLEDVLARHIGLSAEGTTASHHRRGRAAVIRGPLWLHLRAAAQLRPRPENGPGRSYVGLVLANGEIAEHEHYLTRKISNLLDLQPAYLSTAKAAAERARKDG